MNGRKNSNWPLILICSTWYLFYELVFSSNPNALMHSSKPAVKAFKKRFLRRPSVDFLPTKHFFNFGNKTNRMVLNLVLYLYRYDTINSG